MPTDSRLTHSIQNVVFEINTPSYLTPSGFNELWWFWRAVYWLRSWIGLGDSAIQECAQITFDQIIEALTPYIENDPWSFRNIELIRSLYDDEMDLSPLKSSASKACASFENFLIESLGFDKSTLKPPECDNQATSGTKKRSYWSESSVSDLSVEERSSGEGIAVAQFDELVDLEEVVAPPVEEEKPLARSPSPPPSSQASSSGGVASVSGGAAAQEIDPNILVFRENFPLSDDFGDPTHGDWIREIINTIHTTKVTGLLKERKGLERLGENLKKGGVHPLRFLSFILGDDDLRRKLREFGKKSEKLKYKPFVNDLAKDILEREKTENFMFYLAGFATSIGVESGKIQPYFESKKDKDRWQKMIAFLLWNPEGLK